MDIFILVAIVLVGANLTGQSADLCKAMGGTYTPQAAPGEVCPGGRWSNLVGKARG